MQTPAGVGGSDDDLPTLVIWHGRDPRLQAQQQVEEGRDKGFFYLALYRVAEKKFLRLADDELREVQLTPRDRFAFGSDRRGYERRDNIDGGRRSDLHAVDLRTGARSLIRRESRYPLLPSPDGTRALYYDDGQYHVYDFAAAQSRPITTGAPTSFVNVEDDHNVDRPPVPPVGWSADSRFVLLSDRWDVWRVNAAGGATSFVNLTGNGQRDRIRYNRRVVVDPKEKGIDLTKPLYFQTYGERSKKEGLARIAPNRPGAESLLWDDAKFFVSRARDADVWVYTRQTFQQFPDYWTAAGSFASPTRLTDANPQQAEYAWSAGARLIDYVSEKGDSLQASLYLPANYEPGKRYPTVVYIYEKLSQTLHSYAVPNETRAFNPSVYTSRGYAVLQPDIVYRVNDPGMSSVWCVVPAVKAAIATGIVDPAKVGLHGHSWGGYQSAFLSTQTGKLFSGIVSGAPLTDMISMYLSVYWNTGTADMAIFESSQGRFKGSYLDHYDAYVRNSPAFFVNKVETPIMILHNEKDGAVDFNQGITFFNSLREQEKDVIMLQYVGENHGLQQPQNQKDYTMRMQEYFDHYLRGLPAPDWMKQGIPRLEMEKHLKARLKKPKVIS
jgi:dienelactone hydrolase